MTKKLLSHSRANYRVATSTNQRCGNCAMFKPGNDKNKCTLVVDPIRSNFVCDYFEPKKELPDAT